MTEPLYLMGLGFANLLAYLVGEVTATLSATGTTQGTAAPINQSMTIVNSATGGANDSVILTVNLSQQLGLSRSVWVGNTTAATVQLFPPVGHAFNGLAANTAVNIASGKSAICVQHSATAWGVIVGA